MINFVTLVQGHKSPHSTILTSSEFDALYNTFLSILSGITKFVVPRMENTVFTLIIVGLVSTMSYPFLPYPRLFFYFYFFILSGHGPTEVSQMSIDLSSESSEVKSRSVHRLSYF